jgi:hypothetical protein
VSVLHVTNGDSTANGLRANGIEALVWRDVLHDGPVPLDGVREARARFLASRGWRTYEAALAELAHRDEVLDTHDGEFVLWFEADLYDQLQLVEILARLQARAVDTGPISLLCIGEFPGIAHFGGLGELTAAQLATLKPRPIAPAALTTARDAWDVLRSPDPTGLSTVGPTPDLPYLGQAFDRLAREYPSTRDGLGLTERRILAGCAAGPVTRADLFRRVWQREPHPYLGDSSFFVLLDALAPLVDDTGLSGDGRRVLEGTADRIERIGIDRWIGGVHLTDGRWRFHEGYETVTRSV